MIDEEEISIVTKDDIGTGDAEWRIGCAYIRWPGKAMTWPVAPEDIHDKETRKIVQAVHSLTEYGRKVNVVNIAELSGVPEDRLELRFAEWRPIWEPDIPTYCERVQAEGFRTRALKIRKDGYATLARTPWREVETVHAENATQISSVLVNGVGDAADDAGEIFKEIQNEDYEESLPLPFPWPWLNSQTKGGLGRNKKYVFAAPPGNYKSSALYTHMHHATMILGKRWVHFPFDGGSVKEQIMKVFVIHWQHLLMKYNLPLTCSAQTYDGYSDHYWFCNTVVATELRHGKELDFRLPPRAMEVYREAEIEFEQLTRGNGKGLLTFVSSKKVNGDIYRVAQRLRNEMTTGDGLDGWSLDHMGKPANRFTDDGMRIPENTRVCTTFTDMEGPPCILVSQLSQEGIKSNGNGKDVNPHLRYNTELYADADGVFMFQKNLEKKNRVLWINQKNREGDGGPNIDRLMAVTPQTGFVYETSVD